jgi:hypothetical protein
MGIGQERLLRKLSMVKRLAHSEPPLGGVCSNTYTYELLLGTVVVLPSFEYSF